MHAWPTSMLLLLHSAFTLSVVKMLLKGEVGGRALNSHGNYIVDHEKSWNNHGIVFLNFCWNPDFGNVDFLPCQNNLLTLCILETSQQVHRFR